MKHWITYLCLSAMAAQGAALKKAEFTRVVNDVKTLHERASPQLAKVGDVISGRTSVTTGAQSRAELRFEDQTITRLGANSVFSLEEGTRNVDLKQGVLLLQVPKQLGGARVRTAAVTAAVTGTTLLIEHLPGGYIKVIVLEGNVDLFRNDKPSEFRTVNAGDMIIMKPDAPTIPEPVQVDLARLKATSGLVQGFGNLGNERELIDATNKQVQLKAKGDLAPTPLIIRDRGTQVNILPSEDDSPRPRPGFGPPGPPPGQGGAPGAGPPPPSSGAPGPAGAKPLPLIGGVAVIDNDTAIGARKPTITTAFSGTDATAAGKTSKVGPDGSSVSALAFDKTAPLEPDGVSTIGSLPPGEQVTAFKFEELHIIGEPSLTPAGPPVHLALASQSSLTLGNNDPFDPANTASGPWDLGTSGISQLDLIALEGIDWQPTFDMKGTTQTVRLITQPPPAGGTSLPSITLTSAGDPAVSLPNGTFEAHAAGDVTITTPTAAPSPPSGAAAVIAPIKNAIEAANVNITAGENIVVDGKASITAKDSIVLSATSSITVTDTAQLKRLSLLNPLEIQLLAQNGDIDVKGVGGNVQLTASLVNIETKRGNVNFANASINADVVRVRTLAPDGTLTLGSTAIAGNYGIKLYAEGSNGKVLFVGPTSLIGPATIAAKTVQVNPGVTVNVTQPSRLHVHADNQNFNTTGYGNFSYNNAPVAFGSSGGPTKGSFDSRPAFTAGN